MLIRFPAKRSTIRGEKLSTYKPLHRKLKISRQLSWIELFSIGPNGKLSDHSYILKKQRSWENYYYNVLEENIAGFYREP